MLLMNSNTKSAGRIRFCAGGTLFKHSSFRSSNPNSDWPILLWQNDLQKPNISCGSIRNQLWEDKGDIHGQARALCLQWQSSMYRYNTNCYTAKATARELPHVWPLLLADLWRVEDSHHTANSLFTNWQAIEQTGWIWSRYLLILTIVSQWYRQLCRRHDSRTPFTLLAS